jgi:platelet-activating factor acetylhydrolase IB subunit alpha
MDLDHRLQQALEENARLPSGSSSKKFDEDWTPKAHSAKHVFAGHRDRVNAISFHPRYSVIASAGEDAVLKVWDWETGELERTLKGHTMAIKDCEYDSKGMKLGQYSKYNPSLRI